MDIIFWLVICLICFFAGRWSMPNQAPVVPKKKSPTKEWEIEPLILVKSTAVRTYKR